MTIESPKPLASGGYETVFPSVTNTILLHEHPEELALAAGLTPRQWDCLSHYLDQPDFQQISQTLGVSRPNLYTHIQNAFMKLHQYLLTNNY